MNFARLTRYGLLSVTGVDARDFQHAQLTKDVLHLPPDRAVLACWCSAKGRVLASFLVGPDADGFELQLITAARQVQCVPQMVNFEKLGGIDFQKGCYPGQEIVARAQYRGEVKRRMVRLPAPEGAELRPGQEFNGGVVVDSAGGELL